VSHRHLLYPQSTMDRAPRRSTACGPSPPLFSLQNKSEIRKMLAILQKNHVVISYQAAVHQFPNRTPKSKNISKYTPSHFPEITNRSQKFFSPYLCNRNSDFGDSCAKFLRITHSFISCIHNTCLLHIDLLCVWFMLGNAVPEMFFKDFQDQAFQEFQFFFMDQQGKLP
jgi:hypothetical protein